MNRNIGSNRLPIVVAVVSAVAVLTAPWYPGSVSYYLLFQTACGLLATAAFLPPVSHGYAAFAAFLQERREAAQDVAFVLGGAHGIGDVVRDRPHRRLAMAPWTLPHELARLVLAEQLYRAGTIVRGEPYHK